MGKTGNSGSFPSLPIPQGSRVEPQGGKKFPKIWGAPSLTGSMSTVVIHGGKNGEFRGKKWEFQKFWELLDSPVFPGLSLRVKNSQKFVVGG